MERNHPLVRRIAQPGGAEFRCQLEYTAPWRGKHVRVIGRFAPSSRLCVFGYDHHPLTLTDRTGNCPQCERSHDRDVLSGKQYQAFCLGDAQDRAGHAR
jgi:transposase